MGGSVSMGKDNNELVDNLLEADHIKTASVERAMRAVDRGEYFLPNERLNAYKDLAWKSGNLHLSAPCIYSEALEGLCLEPGLSFLNLGSGTGYLSTMAGLILGSSGINHGIEYYDDAVQYANKKLEEFKKYSGAMDEYDFCEPKFKQGNCLCLTSDCHLYDRVYCGAGCPARYESYMKNLLKVGGILVMPLNDHLMQIKHTSESTWELKSLLPVSFATLIQPVEGKHQEWVPPFELQADSLQAMSRTVILNILRKNVEAELPPVTKKIPIKNIPKKKSTVRRLIPTVPIFDSLSDSSDEDGRVVISIRSGRPTLLARTGNCDGFLNQVLGSLSTRNSAQNEQSENGTEAGEESSQNEGSDRSVGSDLGTAPDTMEEDPVEDVRVHLGDANDSSSDDESDVRPVSTRTKRTRQKFDSGIGDEIPEAPNAEVSSDNEGPKWRRIEFNKHVFTSESSSENDTEKVGQSRSNNERRMYQSRYTVPMRSKIQSLPLPSILKNYLNFYREF